MNDSFYAVFLICGPDEYNKTISEVLSSLVSVNDRLLKCPPDGDLPGGFLIRRPFKVKPNEEELYSIASALSDTVSAEAMCRVSVAYDRCRSSEDGYENAVSHAKTATLIGRKFNLNTSILPYHNLGLAKLIYSLSKEARREYILDNLGDFSFSDLDSEMITTIYTFFDTGLSLAKTARALFVHRNTLNYRLDKFEKLSGLNLRKFDDAVVCQIAMLIDEDI